MVKIKICGITNLEDALASIDADCDALGFVFYKKSPRYIAPKKAKEIIKALPKNIIKIGVFVNEKEKKIKYIARLCKLNILQFHGNESAEFCRRFRNYRIIKSFRIKDKIDLEKILKYKTFAYLFDTFVKSEAGGTGKSFDWKLLKEIINNINRFVFLSGGLTSRNIKVAMRTVKPDWVDVSSSVEIKAGKKDHKKIENFIKAVKKS
jgi:phosphoribosylanthranilate isomerase